VMARAKPEEGQKEAILKIITNCLDLPHYKIFYFGSRVNGKGTERSDIDIGIEADGPLPATVLNEIMDELKGLPIMQKIDVVDFKAVDNDFREVALQNIKVIYEK